jgi:hypothetical protein
VTTRVHASNELEPNADGLLRKLRPGRAPPSCSSRSRTARAERVRGRGVRREGAGGEGEGEGDRRRWGGAHKYLLKTRRKKDGMEGLIGEYLMRRNLHEAGEGAHPGLRQRVQRRRHSSADVAARASEYKWKLETKRCFSRHFVQSTCPVRGSSSSVNTG